MLPEETVGDLQTNLTLAFIINNATKNDAGQDINNSDPGTVKNNILSRLAKSKKGKDFSVAWGPAIFTDNGISANLTVVLKRSSDDYRVVTSGTNPNSNYDINNEDNAVFQLQPLNQLIPGSPSAAQISQGAWNGIQNVLTTKSSLDINVPLLTDFIDTISPKSTFQVVGHSLGGALATVLAPYLTYKCQGRTFQCNTFAAPTAGNDSFAAYFADKITDGIRLINTLDCVPCAWNAKSLKKIETIYNPKIKTPQKEIDLIEFVISATKDFEYTQPSPLIPLPGSINENLLGGDPDKLFDTQAGYQHNKAYMDLLGMDASDIPDPVIPIKQRLLWRK